MKVHLLIIDPQVDFCDEDDGVLAVPGADDDVRRLARFIDKAAPFIDEVIVSLDMHHKYDISHPSWFINTKLESPEPFSQITAQDLEEGKWCTVHNGHFERTLNYLKKLKDNERYPHTIWPEHCLIGSHGAAMEIYVEDAVYKWAHRQGTDPRFIMKGMNQFTEHFSAVRAEVIDDDDPSTAENQELFNTVLQADMILLAGEAGSHCLANTALDLVKHFGHMHAAEKLVLLSDTTSPVPGFEYLQEGFIKRLTPLGMRVKTTKEMIEELCS